MEIGPSQKVDILEEKMDYEDFVIIERIIDEFYYSEKKERKQLAKKLKQHLEGFFQEYTFDEVFNENR